MSSCLTHAAISLENPAAGPVAAGHRRVIAVGLAALLGAIVLVTSPPAAAFEINFTDAIKGTGPVVHETRDVGPFDGLSLSTDAPVTVRQGEADGVEVQGEGNVVALIRTRVDGHQLVIDDERSFESKTVKVVITARRLSAMSLGGSTSVLADGLGGPALALSMGGSSVISLQGLKVSALQLSMGGSSAVKVAGAVEELSVTMGGSSAVHAAGLQAAAVSVSGGGSSQALVWGVHSVRVTLGGSSEVGYYGLSRGAVSTGGSAVARYLGTTPPK